MIILTKITAFALAYCAQYGIECTAQKLWTEPFMAGRASPGDYMACESALFHCLSPDDRCHLMGELSNGFHLLYCRQRRVATTERSDG